MFGKILVPLDGTELAEGVLPYVSRLAKGLDIPVALLSVVDTRDIEHLTERNGPGGERRGPYASQVFERVKEQTTKGLAGVADRLESNGVRAEMSVSFGDPADEIVRAAERQECGLIAPTTHGHSPLGRAVLGSTTDKVVHASPVPTLTISPEKAQSYSSDEEEIARLLVPLDGSELAEAALPLVEDLARELSLEIVLVRVVKSPAVSTPYSAYLDYADSVDLDTRAEAEARTYLEGAAERLQTKGLDVRTKVMKGAPAQGLVEVARETEGDIIVLTSHGRSGIDRWVLGSVAEALVRASGDPVLIVRSREKVNSLILERLFLSF